MTKKNSTPEKKVSLKDKFAVIGSKGGFGLPLAKKVGGDLHIATRKEERGENGEVLYKEIDEICEEIRGSSAEFFFVSIATLVVMGNVGEKIYRTIFEEGKVAIDINSVQGVSHQKFHAIFDAVESDTAGMINIHPMHGPKHFKEGDVEKNWILTEVLGKTEKQKKFLRTIIQVIGESKTNTSEGYHLHDISQKTVNLDERFYTGPELHDKATAYFQAIPHMLRLKCEDEEWFQGFIEGMGVNTDLSQGIVDQNPHALSLQEARFSKIPYTYDQLDKKILALEAALAAVQESRRVFSGGEFEFFKTENFRIIDEKIQSEILKLKKEQESEVKTKKSAYF